MGIGNIERRGTFPLLQNTVLSMDFASACSLTHRNPIPFLFSIQGITLIFSFLFSLFFFSFSRCLFPEKIEFHLFFVFRFRFLRGVWSRLRCSSQLDLSELKLFQLMFRFLWIRFLSLSSEISDRGFDQQLVNDVSRWWIMYCFDDEVLEF